MDRALLYFDLDADLRPAFHWNIKQLFVFVVAEYESKANPLNQVIVWDMIVKSPEEAVLKVRALLGLRRRLLSYSFSRSSTFNLVNS